MRQETQQEKDDNYLTISFKVHLEDKFYEKYTRAYKKLQKVDFELEILDKEYRQERELIDYNPITGEKYEKVVTYCDVTLNVPMVTKTIEQKGNEREIKVSKEFGHEAEYLGTINTKDYRTVYATDYAKDNDITLHHEELRCDECGVDRNRNKYFAFEFEGEIKLFGSNCSNSYFGFRVDRLLSVFEREMKEIQKSLKGEWEGNHIDWIASCILMGYEQADEKDEWKSVKEEYYDYINLKSNLAHATDKDFIESIENDIDEVMQLSEEKSDVIEDIISCAYEDVCTIERDEADDFESNLYNAFIIEGMRGKRDTQTLRQMHKKAGIIAWKLYDVTHDLLSYENTIESVEDKFFGHDFEDSEWICEEGEREVFEVRCFYETDFTNRWGRTKVYSFITENGNILNWMTSSNKAIFKGEILRIKGTVKEHDTFKGNKQTKLSRVSIEEVIKSDHR